MIKSIIFFTIVSLALSSSFDTEECQSWYEAAWESKPNYSSIFKVYQPNRCVSSGNAHVVKIALTGTESNRLCTVLVNTSQFMFVEDVDQMDCFRYFDLELKHNNGSDLFI